MSVYVRVEKGEIKLDAYCCGGSHNTYVSLSRDEALSLVDRLLAATEGKSIPKSPGIVPEKTLHESVVCEEVGSLAGTEWGCVLPSGHEGDHRALA